MTTPHPTCFFIEETKVCPKLHTYCEAGLGGCGETESVFVPGTAPLENHLAASAKAEEMLAL